MKYSCLKEQCIWRNGNLCIMPRCPYCKQNNPKAKIDEDKQYFFSFLDKQAKANPQIVKNELAIAKLLQKEYALTRVSAINIFSEWQQLRAG